MADPRAGVKPKVEIDGAELSTDLSPLLELVVVDEHLHQPDMFMLSFRDITHDVSQRAHLTIGGKVKISAPSPTGGTGNEVLIEGEITALEADIDATGTRAIARGYDGSHRLHRGRITQTYQNVTDSDIARTVAQRAGLQPGTIDESKITHEHVGQVNESDWAFLNARAEEIGFEVAVTEGKLHFRKPVKSEDAPAQGSFDSTDPLQLVPGKDLLEFRPRVTSSEQVNDVKVRGWDVKRKQAVIGSASAGTDSFQLPATPSALAGKFGPHTFSEVDHPLTTQSEVDVTAKAVADEISSAVAEAEGVAWGNPKLKAGTAVSIGQVASDFVGRYTLTHTRHIFDAHPGTGYVTRFEVSGRMDRSLLGLVTNGGHAAATGPIHGVVVALVTNNKDPDEVGRVKLKFPWLSDTYESDWTRMTQFGAGPNSGAVFMPEVNDEVLVAFEFGDVRRPIVVGGLYNGMDKPRLGKDLFDNGKVKRRGVVSRKGHRFILFDDDGKSGIALLTSDSSIKISLNETKKEIHVVCKGKVRIEADDDVSITSKNNVKIEGQQVEVSGKSGVKVSSNSAVEVSGQPIKLN
jgi:phage protein D